MNARKQTEKPIKLAGLAAILAGLLVMAHPVEAAPTMELNGQSFGDWSMRCSEVTNQQNQQQVTICEATQRIINAEGQPVMEVIVTLPPGQQQFVGAIIAPLGVVLPAGIAMDVDGNAMGKIPYVRCVQQGCVGQFAFTDAQFAAFKAGAKANITVVRGDGREITVPLSLSGFTAATDSLR